MQENLTTWPSWLNTTLGWIASFIAGGTIFKLIDLWLNRRKPAAEVHVTEASAQEITIRTHSTAGDAVMRMMDRLDQAQSNVDRLRKERDEWELKAFDLQMELRDSRSVNLQLQAQSKLDTYQLHKQMTFIEMRGLKEMYLGLDERRGEGEDSSS